MVFLLNQPTYQDWWDSMFYWHEGLIWSEKQSTDAKITCIVMLCHSVRSSSDLTATGPLFWNWSESVKKVATHLTLCIINSIQCDVMQDNHYKPWTNQNRLFSWKFQPSSHRQKQLGRNLPIFGDGFFLLLDQWITSWRPFQTSGANSAGKKVRVLKEIIINDLIQFQCIYTFFGQMSKYQSFWVRSWNTRILDM